MGLIPTPWELFSNHPDYLEYCGFTKVDKYEGKEFGHGRQFCNLFCEL